MIYRCLDFAYILHVHEGPKLPTVLSGWVSIKRGLRVRYTARGIRGDHSWRTAGGLLELLIHWYRNPRNSKDPNISKCWHKSINGSCDSRATPNPIQSSILPSGQSAWLVSTWPGGSDSAGHWRAGPLKLGHAVGIGTNCGYWGTQVWPSWDKIREGWVSADPQGPNNQN